MPGFEIETSGFNKFRDRLDSAIIQLTAQRIYNNIKEKVPEIEMEKSRVVFNAVGKDLTLNAAQLSSQLQDKLQNCGLSLRII